MPRIIELLAPARDLATAIAAIDHGADAVYMGGPSHGARAAATNSVDDIARAVEYAHRFNARVYVTLNTIVFDSEISHVEDIAWQLYRAGVDALIVQDLGLLRMNLPPIALHASTQCDTRTPQKARFLQDLGFSQIVIARESSLTEIAEICSAVDVPVETFVHGALCVSYSGDCHASQITTGRSANRGECAQICRLSYDLVDKDGNVLIADKHLLSLHDMNRLAYLSDMLKAGASSFKIEGRLKDIAYVKNVVAAYSRALDSICEASPEMYRRRSVGRCALTFTPDVHRSFNRGFTPYFLRETQPTDIARIDTPKYIGTPVGQVTACTPSYIKASLTTTLNNGDGLGYFDKQGKFTGFRLNRADGNRLFPAQSVDIKPGTTLYRNYDKTWDNTLSAASTSTRTIAIDMTLRRVNPYTIALKIEDAGRQNMVEATIECERQEARSPQENGRRDILCKLGGTIYTLGNVSDTLTGEFVPNSVLTSLRRAAIELLDKAQKATYQYEYRRGENAQAQLPESTITYHSAVANKASRQLYTDHGAADIQPALETMRSKPEGSITVMNTRYCLRRQLGACLRTPQGGKLPTPLYIKSRGFTLRLDFDCTNCRMKVLTVK